MNTHEIEKVVVDALLDKKAKDIHLMNINPHSSVCDAMVIATASSQRQASSLKDSVIEYAKKAGLRVLGTEGERDQEWLLIDLGEVLVHIMLEETRAFYQLEKLWQPIASVSKTIDDTSQIQA